MAKLTDARKCALKSLIYARERQVYPTEIVYEVCDGCGLNETDRAFCVNLVRGVVSYQLCLDHVIDNALDKKPKMSSSVRDALRISVYELLFLDKEAYASVSQGIELVKSIASHAAGLASAILHKVSKVCLPDNFALRHGFPEWLGDYLSELLGKDSAELFMTLSCDNPKLQFVSNFLKPPKTPVLGIQGAIDASNAGKVIIADKSAQAIAEEVALAMKQFGHKTLLEVGAGRGTKTALIQSFAASIGAKIQSHDVLDNSTARLDKLKERQNNCGFELRDIICGDATNILLGCKYDFIFIDAPCTGLGTLRRHPEIKSRITRENIYESAKLQLDILTNVSKALDSDGLIFYSTCSVAREENEGVIDSFLSPGAGKNFELDHIVRRAKLTNVTDAHFCACLKRR